MSAIMSKYVKSLREVVGGLSCGPALSVAKPSILNILSRIDKGTLLLVDKPGGTRHIFGQRPSDETKGQFETTGCLEEQTRHLGLS
jgi:hypothetical protein